MKHPKFPSSLFSAKTLFSSGCNTVLNNFCLFSSVNSSVPQKCVELLLNGYDNKSRKIELQGPVVLNTEKER
jgi:hypothetical protein